MVLELPLTEKGDVLVYVKGGYILILPGERPPKLGNLSWWEALLCCMSRIYILEPTGRAGC